MSLSRKKAEIRFVSSPMSVLRSWPPLWNRSSSLPSSSAPTQENWKEALLDNDEGGGEGEVPEMRWLRSEVGPVLKGTLAVYVGLNNRRFVIPTTCLAAPDFQALMEETAEEFGFQQEGGLHLPCGEDHFFHILAKCLPPSAAPSSSKSSFYKKPSH